VGKVRHFNGLSLKDSDGSSTHYFRAAAEFVASAFSSANRAPTRSECFKNLSTQFIMHCSSFDDKALLVKSLQHDMKHRSKRVEYIRMKSCICFFSITLVICACSAALNPERSMVKETLLHW